MSLATDIGAHILPPMPAFYHRPVKIEEIIDQTVGKIFDYLGIDHDLFKRWGEEGARGEGD
jgi:4-hydroxy-3-polyprenylbenzoate decarboxylase